MILPPWHEDAATADRIWRVVLAALGPASDQLWLRFGNLGEMDRFLPPDQVERLEALIGPHWGQPDPIPVPPEMKAGFDDLLSGIVDALEESGFRKVEGEGPAAMPKYAAYSCAVVPAGAELIDLLVNLSVGPTEAEAMLVAGRPLAPAEGRPGPAQHGGWDALHRPGPDPRGSGIPSLSPRRRGAIARNSP